MFFNICPYVLGVSQPILQEGPVRAILRGCGHTRIIREETLCAVRVGRGVTNTFSISRIIFFQALRCRCSHNHAISKLLCNKYGCGRTHDVRRGVFTV